MSRAEIAGIAAKRRICLLIDRCIAAWLVLAMAPMAVSWSMTLPAFAQLSINGKKVTPQQFHGAELANEGIVLLRQNRNAEAAEKLREAVMLNPNLPEAFHNLGLALAKLGDTAGAVQALNQARSMKDLDATWLTLGGLYQANGQVSDALALYRDFTVKFPNHPMVQSGKLESLIRGLEREKNAGVGGSLSGTGSPSATVSGDDYLAQATRSGIVRWPAQRMPIRIFIKDGSRVPGYQSDFNGILRQSFEDWSRASGGLVRFDTASSADQADIVCTWIADPQQLANKAEAGEAHIYGKRASAPPDVAIGTTDGADSAAGSDISRGTILLLTQPLSPGLPVTRNSIRLLCLHEIGHVLGLTGHTIVPSDIMFYSAVSYKDEWRYLSPRDAKTITRLYSSQ
ncbi:MAG: tetratricopeptide repeat protein [Candidatus Obscuribacterales bacterium]